MTNIRIVHTILLTLSLLLPELWLAHTHPWYEPLVSVVYNTFNYSFIVILFQIFSSYIGKICGKRPANIITVLIFTIIVCYSFSQTFLWFNFHRHWDAFTLQLINETTPKESSEFLSAYTCNATTTVILFLYAAVLVTGLWIDHRTKLCVQLRKNWQKILVTLCIIAVYSQVYFLIGNADTNYDRAAGFPIKRSVIFNLRQSILQMKEYEDENQKCIRTMNNYAYSDIIPDDAPDIVWIIGESYNKHHSSIYGYYLETSPCLQRYIDAGKTYAFKDVTAPSNGTSDSFKHFLSLSSCRKGEKWYDAPLVPSIFKHQGWNVVYYSNQFVCEDDLGQWDASMGFINHPYIHRNLFTERNHRTYDYDQELIDDYKINRKKLEGKKNLIIFHLYGQHVEFSQRYPEDFEYFTADSIQHKSLSEAQREVVAQYDNATRYNDFVVNNIIKMFENRDAIIFYFADHGEEIYDFRNHMGRTSLDDDVEEAKVHQLEIPFIISLTDRCAAKRPSLAKRISDISGKPFCTDDFPLMLFDLLNVKTKWSKAI